MDTLGEASNTLGDLVARERRSDRAALRADAADRELDYHDFCTTAWKAGNYLRYLGVGPAGRVAIAADGLPEPILAFLGTGLLGATAEFGVETYAGGDLDPDDTPRVVVAPVEREFEFDLPGGSRLLTYGGVPEQTRTAHWEGDVWSENPAFPPVDVDPGTPVLSVTGTDYSHADVLNAAEEIVSAHEIDDATTVAVRAPLTDAGVVAAGIVAPLLAGGTIVFPGADTVCDVAVGDGPESTIVDPADVL